MIRIYKENYKHLPKRFVNKIDSDIKTKEYRYGIIYIRGKDEFQMEDINAAFDYIPDESNDSVIYMKEPVPIEIEVKPVKKELPCEEE